MSKFLLVKIMIKINIDLPALMHLISNVMFEEIPFFIYESSGRKFLAKNVFVIVTTVL